MSDVATMHGQGTAGPRFSWGFVFGLGVAGGLVAGMTYIVYQMIAAWWLKDAIVSPFRMIAAMLLGRDALADWYSAFAVVLVGLGIHLILAIAFGALFVLILARFPYLAASAFRRIGMGAAFGAGLWTADYYVIAPLLGWYWFALGTHPVFQGLIGHAVFYGGVLGWYCHRRLTSRLEA